MMDGNAPHFCHLNHFHMQTQQPALVPKSRRNVGRIEKFYSIFFQKIAGVERAEPRCPDCIRTPEKNACRPYGLAGISRRRETALFHRFYAYSPLQYNIARFPERLVPQKIVVSCFVRNAGHAVRPANNFLRACVARPVCSSTQNILLK